MGTTGNDGNADPDYETALNERVAANGTGPFRLGATYGTGYSDFDQAFNALSPGEGGGAGTVYTVRSGDTLDGIARMMFGDASLWYMIADANGLSGAARLTPGQQIRIPSQLANVHNTSDTFRPYDTAAHIGDLQPTTPAPPPAAKKGCGAFGAIILAIVAIAVTVVTAGTALSVIAPSAFPTVGAGIGAVLAGSVVGAAGVGVSVGTAVAVGATAAAVGAIASQGLGVATGLQDKFNWKGVALAGISGGLGGALGTVIKGTGFLAGTARGVAGSTLGQGIGVATGLQNKFDWAGVAAAGISGGVGASVGKAVGAGSLLGNPSLRNVGANLLTGGAGLLANAATRSILTGSDFGDNVMAGLPDVIGQTIGNAIAGKIASDGTSISRRSGLIAAAGGAAGVMSDIGTPAERAMAEALSGAAKSGAADLYYTYEDGLIGTVTDESVSHGLGWKIADALGFHEGGFFYDLFHGRSSGSSFVNYIGLFGQNSMALAAAEDPMPGAKMVWRAGTSAAFHVSDINPAWGSYHFVDGDSPVFIPGARYNDPSVSLLAPRPVSYFEVGGGIAGLVPAIGGTGRLLSSMRAEGVLSRGLGAAEKGVPAALRTGVADEVQWLGEIGASKNTVTWRPTQADIDSAAFQVIVGPAKYTAGGKPVGTILDVTEGGFREFKSGASVLDSSYQLRLQTYFSYKPPSGFKPGPLTIETTRPVNPGFQQWLDRWGIAVAPSK